MTGALLVTMLCAAASPKLASGTWSGSGVTPEQLALFSEHFAVKLSEAGGFAIVTSKDLAALLGVEKQKQLLGCAETSTNCIAELAGALGADGLITGQLSHVGSSLQVIIKILSSSGRALFSYSSNPIKSDDEMLTELTAVAERAAAQLPDRLRLETPEAARETRSLVPLVPAIAGVLLAAVGVGIWVDVGQRYGRLLHDDIGPDEALALKVIGERNQVIAIALTAVGAAAFAVGIAWFAISPRKSVTVALTPSGVSIAGALP